jgi:hypothetical protein
VAPEEAPHEAPGRDARAHALDADHRLAVGTVDVGVHVVETRQAERAHTIDHDASEEDRL